MNKSIVTFTRGTLAQATPLWQYDYGQVLEINGLELPTTYQVHFCNCSDTQTITVLGNADGVLIPDNLLQTGKTVIAYIYLHTGADDGETEYKITIPIRTRPAPSDIPPTPEQQSALDEAIAALNSAVENVEEIADGIPDQIDTALEEAKESGEFDGPPGPKGDAYVLTAADREEIAGIASDDVLVVSDEEPTGEPLPKIWIDDSSGDTIAIPTMEDIGDLDDLVTTAKNNLVAAINEAAQRGGGGITVDSELSATSENPVQNKAIYRTFELAGQQINRLAQTVEQLGTDLNNKADIEDLPDLTGYATEQWVTEQGYINRTDLDDYRTAAEQDAIDQQIADAIPTKTSDLHNDSGYLTQHQSLAAYRTAADQDLIDAGKADKVQEVTVATDGAVSQTVEPGKAYHFTGNLTSLTITAATPGEGQYHLDFISGATAPTVTLPGAWIMPDGWTVEANTRYEIDVLDGYAVAQGWGVST